MKVRMRTTVSGPDYTAVAGQVVNVPDTEAADLINGRYAEAVGETKKPLQPEPASPYDEFNASDLRAELESRELPIPEGSAKSKAWRDAAISALMDDDAAKE